jgi:hypothetical protein
LQIIFYTIFEGLIYMVNTTRTPITTRMDSKAQYGKLKNTRLYEDAVYEKFSDAEMERRYKALRAKMARLGVDALIVTGGPSHWSFGGGMRWLTGHWEWHAVATYVLVPMQGDLCWSIQWAAAILKQFVVL